MRFQSGLVLALLGVPAVVATVLLGLFLLFQKSEGRVSPIPTFAVGCVVYALWMRLRAVLQLGRSGTTPEQARRNVTSASSGRSHVADPTELLDGFSSSLDPEAPIDARELLPGLVPLVAGVAQALGVDAPEHVYVIRLGGGVWLNRDGTRLAVGTPFLMVASIGELRGEIARQLAPRRRPAVTAALWSARVAVTAATFREPGVTNRVAAIYAPARAVAGPLSRAGSELAGRLRDESARVAWHAAGPEAATGETRAAATVLLWRAHLAAAQRAWTETGVAVAPHATWPAAWSAATGRAVAPGAEETYDAVAALGWPSPPLAPAAVPPLPSISALQTLVGAGTDAFVRGADDVAASQYYAPPVNERFGAAVPTAVADGPAAALADTGTDALPAPGAPPGGSVVAPPRTVVELDVLLHDLAIAMNRRDAGAVRLAHASRGPDQPPAVLALAAGVLWLAGDPAGPRAIHDVLLHHARAGALLSDLAPSARAAGQHELAAAIDAAAATAADVIHEPLALRRMWGRSTKTASATAPPAVEAILADAVRGLPSVKNAWLVEFVVGPEGRPRPTAVVFQRRWWTLERLRLQPQQTVLAAVEDAWPLTRLINLTELEGRGRRRVRKGRALPLA